MKKLSALLLLFAASVALGGQGMGPGPGVKGYSGGGGGLTVQVAQATVAATQVFGTATSITRTITSSPQANNLVVCAVGAGDTDGAGTTALPGITMSDNFGDGGSWTAAPLNPVTSAAAFTGWVFYRPLLSNAAASPSVTATTSNATSPALTLACTVLSTTSGTPTWSVDGTPVSLTGTTPGGGSTINTGSITTTNASTFVMGWSGNRGGAFTAGSGFTTGSGPTYDGNRTWLFQYKIPTASGAQGVTFTDPTGAAQPYLTLGIAFKAN